MCEAKARQMEVFGFSTKDFESKFFVISFVRTQNK
jgi:hypothetical protein